MRIYLIDDDSAVLSVLRLLIEDGGLGTVVGSSQSAVDALEDLRTCGADIVLVDLLMPEMDGFDLLMKVRNDEMLCHIPFILLSVVDSVDSKIKGLEYGADVYIEKPFSLGYVKATVESLLENRERAFRHFASRPGFQYEM